MDKYKKNIAKIVWPDDSELSASDDIELKMINEFHGDHDEDWIIEIKNGEETARHNVKFISYIEWQNKPEICPQRGTLAAEYVRRAHTDTPSRPVRKGGKAD